MSIDMANNDTVQFLKNHIGTQIIITFGKFDPKTKVGNTAQPPTLVNKISKQFKEYKCDTNTYCVHKYLNKEQYINKSTLEMYTTETFQLDSLIDNNYCCCQVAESIISDFEFPQINQYNDIVEYEQHCYNIDPIKLYIKKFTMDDIFRYEVSLYIASTYTQTDIPNIIDIINKICILVK